MSTETLQVVKLADLRDSPYQPRQDYDPAALAELADNIRQNGVLSPLTVRPVPGNGHFEIIGGHRRRRAAELAGLSEVPCVVRDCDDDQARLMALLDNLAREDLLPWEEGQAFADLMAAGMSVSEVARAAAKSSGHVQGRVLIATRAGQVAREAYRAGRIGLVALQAIAEALPSGEVRYCECPRCRVVLAEGTDRCPGCGDGLTFALWLLTDAQAQAVKQCTGRPAHVAADVCRMVAERCGLANTPVQTSLGFADVQIAAETVAAKSELERRLGQIGGLRDWAVQEGPRLRGLPATQKASATQMIAAARTALRQIEEALTT